MHQPRRYTLRLPYSTWQICALRLATGRGCRKTIESVTLSDFGADSESRPAKKDGELPLSYCEISRPATPRGQFITTPPLILYICSAIYSCCRLSYNFHAAERGLRKWRGTFLFWLTRSAAKYSVHLTGSVKFKKWQSPWPMPVRMGFLVLFTFGECCRKSVLFPCVSC